jgi:large subunit ribosomal protein L3
MINTIFATKKAMAQAFTEGGKRLPVTVLSLPDHVIAKINTKDKDGYEAVQIAVGKKRRPANKPLFAHLKKANIDYKPAYLREVKVESLDDSLKEGTILDLASIVSVGDTITVTGTSKGKGFQGGVKRHGFHGGPKTHGQSDRHRAPGSIGQRTTPGRVLKDTRMAGHMGVDTVTIKNLKVAGIDFEKREIQISGPIPGSYRSLIRVQITKKANS